MKKMIILLVLLTGITGKLCAQRASNAEKIFDVPEGSFKRSFTISLDNGNKMQLELTDMGDLAYLKNIDSLVRVVINDLALLKDSLADELKTRHVDYIIDSSGIKKIRIQKINPVGSHFVINKGGLASLKTDQDIVSITIMYKGKIHGTLVPRRTGMRYYRVIFFLNDLADISHYMHGQLNEKINGVAENYNKNWSSNKDGTMRLSSMPEISAPGAHGYIGGSDMLTLRLSADIQNYKNYFVPSASLGFAIITNINLVRREYGLGVEYHFLFAKNNTGKLQTYVNPFVSVSYGRRSLKEPGSKQHAGLYPYISLGYQLKRKGDFYEKNTFKVGLGSFSLFGGGTKIEPTFYFNDFFKGVTPSLRIMQNF